MSGLALVIRFSLSICLFQLVKQLLVTHDEMITFQTDCNAVVWLSESSPETKSKGTTCAVFCLHLAFLIMSLIPKHNFPS